ncbi:hypothetical protein [Deinococcus hopiensis]|uniref:Uncharacterized protein n=1 Tax=Deinococcus hopiensis KR-140 TaxID=695939 RepID=A0A1W1UVU3_9DEIO|nr:hypothetical protein [Deinococcus hopiensis]SMB85156.1 hypothetical protein SAMN00790413_03289 [Deinococcus hopiensis KR-140]
MSKISGSLAALRQMREGERTDEKPAPIVEEALPGPATPKEEVSATVLNRGEGKTLAGRVPLALHRELTRALLDAADEMNVRRVNVDEALEAAVRVALRHPEAHGLWLQEILAVRRERREE